MAKEKQKRGFAVMSKEARKKIASMGGKASRGGGACYHKKSTKRSKSSGSNK